MYELSEIANRCQTDKGTLHWNGHGYTIVYDMLFAGLRDRPIKLLEIGLLEGGPEVGGSVDRNPERIPSIQMWHEYFPNGHIYGLDISDFKGFETEWFTFFRADCGNQNELRRVTESGVKFDIIIDDGSHASFHQQLAFRELFPALNPGGFYSIEDLTWQPQHLERELPRVESTIDFLRRCGHPVLFFGEDQLWTLRRSQLRGIKADQLSYIDRFTVRGYVRRLGEAVTICWTALGGEGAVVPPRTKLAIVQKQFQGV